MTRLPQRVEQFALGFNVPDAMGEFAVALRAALAAEGIGGGLWAEWSSLPAGDWHDYRTYRHAAGAIALLHYTTGCDVNRFVADLPGSSILYYHNITPSYYFAGIDPVAQAETARGRAELAAIVPRFAACWTHSAYSAAELHEAGARAVRVVPLLRDTTHLDLPPDPAWAARLAGYRGITILSVSRLAPNKGDEDLLAALAHLRRRGISARLIRTGDGPDAWRNELRARAAGLGIGADLQLTGPLPQAALNACWRAADVYACTSEHEGFGMPLREAMHFGVPVVALDRAAVAETLAGSGILLRDSDASTLAAALHAAATDAALRPAVIDRQQQAAAPYQPAAVRAVLHAALAELPSL